MKFHASLAVVLTIARFAEPQNIGTLPSCAYLCVYDTDSLLSDSTLCGSSDYACQCTNEEYLGDILCCLYEQCSDSARQDTEDWWREFCGYLDHTVPSEISCSTVDSSSADMQSTETSGPEPSSVTAESTTVHGSIATTEMATADGSSTTAERTAANNGGSETAANSASETSNLSESDKSGSGTTKSSDALVLKLGLGLGIALGVPLLVAAIYVVHLQRKKVKQQGTPNNQELQVSSYQAPPPQGYPPPSYPAPEHTAHGYPVQSSAPPVGSQQEPSDPYKYEHGSGVGGAVVNEHEVLGDTPSPRHELPSNNPQSHSELPPDARPRNELP